MEKSCIETLITSDSREVSRLYNSHRDAFLYFGKKYGLDYDDLTDIYQEAFIAIRNHAVNGKLNTVKSSFKTYLFGIAKYKIFDLIKEKQKTTSFEASIHITDDKIEPISIDNEPEVLTLRQQILLKFFNQLGKKCQELLTMFYSRGLSIDEIIDLTDYKSNAVVRSQKSRCIKNLKEMINS
jgi:RNA polymerase sigma factor (sigma-70 family)